MSKIAHDNSIINSICKAYFDRQFDLQSVFRSSIRFAKRISIRFSKRISIRFARLFSIVKSICKVYFDKPLDCQFID